MEALAYLSGFTLNLASRYRRRELETQVAFGKNMWLMVGALAGALCGAKLLAIAESPQQYGTQAGAGLLAFVDGKTIVGGLLGGWLGIEIAKKCTHVSRSTGDGWVLPLIVAMSIGRVGCFLTGLSDQTHGIETALPWGVDFGDHVSRHPTQLYEIAFLLLIAPPLVWLDRRPHTPGLVFRLFMLSYLAFRFTIEFIKPTTKPFLGLSAIQITCLCGAIYCIYSLRRYMSAAEMSPSKA